MRLTYSSGALRKMDVNNDAVLKGIRFCDGGVLLCPCDYSDLLFFFFLPLWFCSFAISVFLFLQFLCFTYFLDFVQLLWWYCSCIYFFLFTNLLVNFFCYIYLLKFFYFHDVVVFQFLFTFFFICALLFLYIFFLPQHIVCHAFITAITSSLNERVEIEFLSAVIMRYNLIILCNAIFV